MNIPAKDLKIDTYRATGNGGQNVNKVESAVRITHLPTGLVVQCQDERSQPQNRERAMAELVRRLKAAQARVRLECLNRERRRQQTSGRVRSYDLTSNLVVDHRTGKKSSRVRDVLDGHLELVR